MTAVRTVLLSSTARDLSDYRAAVFVAIQGLDGFRCIRMEDFGARPATPEDVSRQMASDVDLYVGIVGHLHGSSPAGSTASYTELEYEAAIAAGRPCLIFLAPDDFPLPASLRESDEKQGRQVAFRERVRREQVLAPFKSPEDLAARIVIAIRNWEVGLLQRETVQLVLAQLPSVAAAALEAINPLIASLGELMMESFRYVPREARLQMVASLQFDPRNEYMRDRLRRLAAMPQSLPEALGNPPGPE